MSDIRLVERKRILYAVLNWGLGHATRSIPVIRACLELGHHVTLASDGLSLRFLNDEFPQTPSVELPGYDVFYPGTSVVYNALHQFRNVQNAVSAERDVVARWTKANPCDAIISDNRYGCYSANIPSAIISHIINLPGVSPPVRMIANRLIRRRLRKFDRVWVPDEETRAMSGILSEFPDDDRVEFLGILSDQQEGKEDTVINLACVLSGPEPQRSLLQDVLAAALEAIPGVHIMVRGVAGPLQTVEQGNVTIHTRMNRREINRLLNGSEVIVCRSGYTSLMDLAAVGRKAILIPTPGQPEQEYLARLHGVESCYEICRQDDLRLKEAYEMLKDVSDPKPWRPDPERLRRMVSSLF